MVSMTMDDAKSSRRGDVLVPPVSPGQGYSIEFSSVYLYNLRTFVLKLSVGAKSDFFTRTEIASPYGSQHLRELL